MHGIVCYLYLFTCGSYLGWAFWPNIPFLAILGSSVKRGEVTKGSFRCWRSPVLDHEMRRGWLSFGKVPFAW